VHVQEIGLQRRPVRAAAVAAAVVLVLAPPVQAATREPAPKDPTAGLKQLWSQFPLDQAPQRSKAVATTTHAAATPTSTTRAHTSPPSASSASWIPPLAVALIALLCLGALALYVMRPVRRQRRTRGELTQWPRGHDLVSEDDKATRASLDSLNDRVSALLRTAEDAAEEIRQMAEQESAEVRAQAERYSSEARRRADAAAAEKQAEADRILRSAHERAERTEHSAVEHWMKVVGETEALHELLDDRRRWLQDGVRLDDELLEQAHESAKDSEREEDKAGDKAEDVN
jgi:hypothetical protein